MSDYAYEEEQVGELTVKVYQDEFNDNNPLEDYKPEWLEIIHWHRRNDWRGMTNVSRWDREDIEEYINRPEVVAYPLNLYEHGQCAFSISSDVLICRWDSGQVGFVLVDKKLFMQEWGWKRMSDLRWRKMRDVVDSYIKEFDQWQRGEVYGFVVSSDDDDHMDSCWGFIGDIEGCLEEGVASAEYLWRTIEEDRAKEKRRLDEEFDELVMGQTGDMLLGAMPPLNYEEIFYDN